MYKNELDFKLKSADFPRYFMLYGAEDYQIEHYTKEILAKFQAQPLSLFFKEYDFSKAKTHLEQDSLFGDLNLLHIKADDKIPLKELKILVSLALKSQSSIFIYELHDGDQKNIAEHAKVFGENFVRFFPPKNQIEAIELLNKHANKLKLKANKEALEEIYKIHNRNIYLAAAELNRLAAMHDEIDLSIINALVSSLSSVNYDDLFSNILDCKDTRNDIMNFLKNSGLEETAVINSLYRSFYRLFTLHSAWKLNPSADIKEILGYAPPVHVVNTLKKQTRRFSSPMFLDIFIHLNSCDYELKKPKNFMDKELFLLYSILELQNIIAKHSKN